MVGRESTDPRSRWEPCRLHCSNCSTADGALLYSSHLRLPHMHVFAVGDAQIAFVLPRLGFGPFTHGVFSTMMPLACRKDPRSDHFQQSSN